MAIPIPGNMVFILKQDPVLKATVRVKCFPHICNLGLPDISIDDPLPFNIKPHFLYVCIYQRCPQTLATIRRNRGIYGVFRAVATTKNISAFYLMPYMSSTRLSVSTAAAPFYLGMDKWFHPTLYTGCNYISMLGLKLIHVSRWGPEPEITQ